jgi:hypothetical protein
MMVETVRNTENTAAETTPMEWSAQNVRDEK